LKSFVLNIKSSMSKTSPFFQNDDTEKIGIMGGTFNPPHLGHLRLAEEVAWEHGLDRIVFIPCFVPPHKSNDDVAPAEQRLEMTRLACNDNPKFQVSDLEIMMKGASYTVNTLEHFAETRRGSMHFILGTDSLRDVRTWKDPERLFGLANFIVVTRPGTDFQQAWQDVPRSIQRQFQPVQGCYVHTCSTRLVPSGVTGLNISATGIRNLLKAGRSIRYLVPEPVRSYILETKLYLDRE